MAVNMPDPYPERRGPDYCWRNWPPVHSADCGCRTGAKGWSGLPEVPADGQNWPLDFAARLIGIPERDLRDLVRIAGLAPAGTMKTAAYARSGRNPRVYDGAKLIRLCRAIAELEL